MAFLSVVLGPALWIMAGTSYAVGRLLHFARTNPDVEVWPLPKEADLVLDFADLSLPIVLPLGLILLWGGFAVLRRSSSGRRALRLAALLTTGGMLALGAVWWKAAADVGLASSYGVAGVIIHLVQAGLVLKAASFLGHEEVIRACDEPDAA